MQPVSQEDSSDHVRLRLILPHPTMLNREKKRDVVERCFAYDKLPNESSEFGNGLLLPPSSLIGNREEQVATKQIESISTIVSGGCIFSRILAEINESSEEA